MNGPAVLGLFLRRPRAWRERLSQQLSPLIPDGRHHRAEVFFYCLRLQEGEVISLDVAPRISRNHHFVFHTNCRIGHASLREHRRDSTVERSGSFRDDACRLHDRSHIVRSGNMIMMYL